MALVWSAPTLLDFLGIVAMMTQVMEVAFTKKWIKEINGVIYMLHYQIKLSLCFKPLDKNSLHLRVYSDASLSDNTDGSTQLGYIILFSDYSN